VAKTIALAAAASEMTSSDGPGAVAGLLEEAEEKIIHAKEAVAADKEGVSSPRTTTMASARSMLIMA